MARAGYDPREALVFWERMAAASRGQSPPQFLSTHPSHETRIRDLQRWMPDAETIFTTTEKK
jgi:predicted Zn-dependent protease